MITVCRYSEKQVSSDLVGVARIYAVKKESVFSLFKISYIDEGVTA